MLNKIVKKTEERLEDAKKTNSLDKLKYKLFK